MLKVQTSKTNAGEYSRCEERRRITDHGKTPGPVQRADAEIKENIYQALWKDDVIRSLEYYEIDIHVKNGVVHLNGHIVGSTSEYRIENALRSVSGIMEIKNNLILDDKLTLEIASSLGALEHAYGCKFFTGSSHGVVSLNGKVNHANVKLLAEKCAAGNPNVRGVINNIKVSTNGHTTQDQTFLQPTIGEMIYFLDGVTGVVQQVVMNPNNRRVTAMNILGRFDNPDQELNSMNTGEVRPPEQLITVPMEAVRYMTKTSGFLRIHSYESNRYMDFDSEAFFAPENEWTPPYPYCPENVLFPVRYRTTERQITDKTSPPYFEENPNGATFKEQFFANGNPDG